MRDAFYLTVSCANQPGIVAAVAACLFEAGGNILEAQQFDDLAAGRFFMRVELDVAKDSITAAALRERFTPIGNKYAMEWKLRSRTHKQRVLLLVSKFDHCLGDLLYRWRIGEMPMEPVGIVSNHPKEALNLSLIGNIPYHHLPVTAATKPQQSALDSCSSWQRASGRGTAGKQGGSRRSGCAIGRRCRPRCAALCLPFRLGSGAAIRVNPS